MKLESLHDLYLNELKDLYSAEHQILKALPKVIEKTTNPQLRQGPSRTIWNRRAAM